MKNMQTTYKIAAFGLIFGAFFVARDSAAVGTRTFDLDTLEEFSGGDLHGVAVSSDGAVRTGWTLGDVPLTDASASFSALALNDGSVLVGTSPSGKVFRVVGDKADLFADTHALAVTSMVEGAGGVVYAATMPEGKIFKISQGKADVLTTLPDTSHVWALTWDKTKSALFAAVGPDGRVFRVTLDGKSSVFFHCDQPHVVSLALAENGDLLAGSSGKARLYRITGPGRATVVSEFPGTEVKAIAVAKNDVVYAISNEYSEPPEAPRRGGTNGRGTAGPVITQKLKPGKGTLTRFDASGRPEKMMHNDEFHYTALAVDADGKPFVGTGAEGRVYSVDDTHVVTLVADADEAQVGALGFNKGVPFLATSDGAAFHRVVAQGGSDSVWTSKVFDAGLKAKYGQISWRSSGPLELSTRTGNTSAPDATWSGWSNAVTQPQNISSPQARFIQVRARWGRDAKAVLTEVMLPFVTENVRPVVLDIDAEQKGGSARGTKEGLQASGGEPPKHDSVMKLSWRVDNPDADQLRYRVDFRREGQNVWRDALKPGEVLTKNEYEWDTLALPEGKYRVRVEASDEPANPPSDVQKHALESQPVLVDNTPPVVTELSMNGRKLHVRAVDGLGPIARVEMSVDGKLEWRPLAPADGLFDTSDEKIDADVSSLVPAGAHIVTVRAYDAAGNSALRETESR
jgi:hypothetical protein